MDEKVEEPQEQPSDRAPMPDEELQKILAAHRKWVESEGKEGKKADLVRANLRVAYLFDANLQEAFLTEANLQGANLSLANLQGAVLYGANLQGAALRLANLQKAYLRGANLQKADLREANLFKANLQKAYLGEANLQGAKLQGAALREATGFTASQVKLAKNWELALYSDDSLKKLGLKPDHNERVKKKLAEVEKEKKATGEKP